MTWTSCSTERVPSDLQPTYQTNVGALLANRCGKCHTGANAPNGWRVDDYATTIACTNDGIAVTVGANDALLLKALARPDHAGFVTDDELATLRRWLSEGAPSTNGGVHPSTFADPRTIRGHAQFLRNQWYRPMTDPNDADACGHCHAGAPVNPATFPAPGATPCTTCHGDEGGVTACTTCHGAPGRSYPPRDLCFFPEAAAAAGAHARHAGATGSRAEGLPCTVCHPTPTRDNVLLSGTAHLDTHVEVFFDYARAGNQAQFDATTKRCTGTCHARGGARPDVAWTDPLQNPAQCNDCHGAPPANHYAGACTSCHREANATGTALTNPVLHVNGRVDLGDGSGQCGACHGAGESPWPSSGAHAAHANPSAARPVPCESCHSVPSAGQKHPIGGGARVTFGGLAIAGGSRATFDPTTKTCSQTYCHTGRGANAPDPKWTDGPSSAACGACHSIPPPAPHATETNCGANTLCHQGSLSSGTTFTALGKAAHVDGTVTRGL
ncbi:CxxxxCH/CxxCH domain c-type cytochrome [Labilithrix luteola]|uniref:CxxxxCH/CxxCH domain c-type cytochrome n=1 Tax=Labilithrix luteola TaxID=1391654 RepID=UPI00147460B2|nr:CxxxxCH/CxxCH domain-containing protein [Labilithrix luteola]